MMAWGFLLDPASSREVFLTCLDGAQLQVLQYAVSLGQVGVQGLARDEENQNHRSV